VRASLRHRLSYANVMATVAVFIALGGSSYAALRVTGRNVPKDALTGADIKNLAGKDVRNHSPTGTDAKKKSLTPKDFTGSVRGHRARRARVSTRSQPGGAQAHLQRAQGALELTSGMASTTR